MLHDICLSVEKSQWHFYSYLNKQLHTEAADKSQQYSEQPLKLIAHSNHWSQTPEVQSVTSW